MSEIMEVDTTGDGNGNTDSSGEDHDDTLGYSKEANKSVYSNAITIKNEVNSDEEGVMPQVYVQVEIEEGSQEDFEEESSSSKRKHSPDRIVPQTVPRKKRYKCKECNTDYETLQEYKTHCVQHQVETRHKCEECGRCFSKGYGLKNHLRMHGEKRIKCPLCEATFRIKFNLARHMVYHEKEVKCEECKERFYTQDELQRHRCGEPSETVDFGPETSQDLTQESLNQTQETNPNTSAETIKSEYLSDQCEALNGTEQFQPPTDENGLIYRRIDVDYQTQCAIINKMLKGRSVQDICQLYNIMPYVVDEIWETRDDFDNIKKAGRTTLKNMYSVLDVKILDWFNDRKKKQMPLSGKIVTDYAEMLAKEYGFVAFNGSKKWLDRFKTKYKIAFRDSPYKRDYSSKTDSKWKKVFLSEQWMDARNGFTDDEIYSGDEIGFYFNPSRGRIQKLGGKKFIHGFPKDRIAIFACTNSTGTDKKKLFICGSEDPLLRSYKRPDSLPCTYIRHPEAHFTTPMFEEYVKMWNLQLQQKNKKALLIVDRATIHSKLTLSHLKLLFVPWKASTTLMPTKNGIFKKFTSEFVKLLYENKSVNCLRGVERNLNLTEVLHMLEKAWDRTPGEIIMNSFEATGYDVTKEYFIDPVPIPTASQNDEELLTKFVNVYDIEEYYKDIGVFNNYITVDEELLSGQGTNCSVFGGNHKAVDPEALKRELSEILPIGTEKPESNEVETKLSSDRALNDLEIVKKYLLCSPASYEVYQCFFELEKFILSRATVD